MKDTIGVEDMIENLHKMRDKMIGVIEKDKSFLSDVMIDTRVGYIKALTDVIFLVKAMASEEDE